MSILFSPLRIRGVELKNRIVVSPMCQYSSIDGMPNDWHLVHLGSRAVGGAALVIMEATAVSPEGRISPEDGGIWNDEHVDAYKKITSFISSQNSIPGIQLAHAGRKASTYSPWKGKGAVAIKDGGWQTIAPSAIPFAENYPLPVEMTKDDIRNVINQFKSAAERSISAGFRIIELHMAHGYLIHEFLSPHSNQRKDNYGGSLENRSRLALEIAKVVRETIPGEIPLFARISSTDWIKGGWDIEQSIQLARWLKESGIDLIDCSSGGNVVNAQIPAGPGYQVIFSERIKKEAEILTGAVGLITSPMQAENIIRTFQADVVILAREILRNPYWPLYAAKELNTDLEWPVQYLRAKQ
ncbi:MAG TPA: NADH:flavin oxidoreductase/NADH oxidase [Ignavibacteriaceae bacterium]|nr:NADH:flavin oxidoreductase/NADH oxidase [Ignavibacteriaceae bacterium]